MGWGRVAVSVHNVRLNVSALHLISSVFCSICELFSNKLVVHDSHIIQ
jgi:hypothetical protein